MASVFIQKTFVVFLPVFWVLVLQTVPADTNRFPYNKTSEPPVSTSSPIETDLVTLHALGLYIGLGVFVIVAGAVLGSCAYVLSFKAPRRSNNPRQGPCVTIDGLETNKETCPDDVQVLKEPAPAVGAVAIVDTDIVSTVRIHEPHDDKNIDISNEDVARAGTESAVGAVAIVAVQDTDIVSTVRIHEPHEETNIDISKEDVACEGTESGICDAKLWEIANQLGPEWKCLATTLGFTFGEIFQIKNDNPDSTANQIFALLHAWRGRQSSADDACSTLWLALKEIGRVDLSKEVKGIIHGNIATSLKIVQKELAYFTKVTANSIPLHPLIPWRRANMNEFFVNPELISIDAQKSMPSQPLSGANIPLDALETMKHMTWKEFLGLMGNGEARKNRILLSAGAGCGKTTLWMKVANDLAINFEMVVPLRLKLMVKSGCLIDAMLNQILPKNTKVTPLRLKEVIDTYEEGVAILLDGLDEISPNVLESSEGLLSIKDVLENRVLVKSCVLVTTRPYMVDNVLGKYPHYEVIRTSGFSQQKCHQFILNFFKGNVEKAYALIAQLTASPSLKSIAQIPIITLILCLTWEDIGSMSNRLADLYNQFAGALVRSGTTRNQENQVIQLVSILNGLGSVALNGLLRSNGETLIFSPDDFSDGQVYEHSCRYGFLIEQSCLTGLEVRRVVMFIHKTVQEFCAASFLVNLLDADKEGFERYLKDVVADNVFSLEYLLRFCCGKSLKAAYLIVEHVLGLNGDEARLHRLARLLVLESGSKELASKLHPQTNVKCETADDLKAFAHYLECVGKPVSVNQMDILVSSGEDAQLLGECLRRTNMKVVKQLVCKYNLSEGWKEHLKQLEQAIGVGKIGCLVLAFGVPDHIQCDMECVSDCVYRVSKMVGVFGLILQGLNFIRSKHDINRLVEALSECALLICFVLSNIDMRGKLSHLKSLFSTPLEKLVLHECHLCDDDSKDLIRVIPSKHSLHELSLTKNVLSLEAIKALTLHLRKLPKLSYLGLADTCSDTDKVSSIVSHNFPHMVETDVSNFFAEL